MRTMDGYAITIVDEFWPSERFEHQNQSLELAIEADWELMEDEKHRAPKKTFSWNIENHILHLLAYICSSKYSDLL